MTLLGPVQTTTSVVVMILEKWKKFTENLWDFGGKRRKMRKSMA